MMEFYRGTVLANWAYRKQDEDITWDSIRKRVSDYDSGWSSRFHLWEYNWNDDSAFIYMDGELLNSIDLDVAQEGDYNPFRSHDHYMLINLAIGGNSGGDPSQTEFPMYYEVDYVRVYQWNEELTADQKLPDGAAPAVRIRRQGRLVTFQFLRSGESRISIHSSDGRKLQELEGEGTIIWDSSQFGKGFYLVRFENGLTRKIIVL